MQHNEDMLWKTRWKLSTHNGNVVKEQWKHGEILKHEARFRKKPGLCFVLRPASERYWTLLRWKDANSFKHRWLKTIERQGCTVSVSMTCGIPLQRGCSKQECVPSPYVELIQNRRCSRNMMRMEGNRTVESSLFSGHSTLCPLLRHGRQMK